MGSSIMGSLRLWIAWLMVGASFLGGSIAVAESTITPGSRAAGETACVEPTDVMRRNHMEFIKHQRDRTVHQGIRGSKHSLVGCVDCHASVQKGQPVPVDAEGQFCESCHSFTAVSIDCFGCHRNLPSENPAQAASFGALRGHAMAMRSWSSERRLVSGQSTSNTQGD